MAEELFEKNKRVLILVESPEKAKTISKIFRDAGYSKVVVQATIGHFTKIAEGDGYYNTGIYPEKNFEAHYIIDPNKKDIVKKLKEQVKMADFVYICSDPDREGESIGKLAVKFLGIPKSKYKRATYQAINQKAIFEAIRNAGDIDENLASSAHARKCLDKGMGFRLTNEARDVGKWKSVGRCQSAGLKLIVDREKEIQNFVPETYFDLYLNFVKNNTKFKAKYVGTDKKQVKRINNKEQVDSIINECKGNPFIIGSIEFKDKKENPKPPFSTVTFQKECANKLGLKIKQAAECAQKLFDAGKISYHRTDSEEFEEEFTNELIKFVSKTFDKKYISGTVIKGKKDKNAQEGHEALHVLDLNLTPELYAKEAPNELLSKVYRIIYNRTVATALKPAIISQTIYNIYNKDNKFVLNSNKLKFDGYRCIYSYKDDSDEKDEIVRETFVKGENLEECNLEKAEKETTPPSRYKEDTLEDSLKKEGIGRPSTYHTIIGTIESEERGYCVVEDKYLKPTEKGIALIDFLDKNFSNLINSGYTREMEESLDMIAQGNLNHIDFLKEFFNNLDNSISKVHKENKNSNNNSNEIKCPLCGAPMKLRKGRYGNFFGCTNYPNCNGMRKQNGDEIKTK